MIYLADRTTLAAILINFSLRVSICSFLTYSNSDLVNYNGEYVIEDRLFKQDFGYHLKPFDWKKKLKLNKVKNDINDLNFAKLSLNHFKQSESYRAIPDSFKGYYEYYVENYGYVGYKAAAVNAEKMRKQFEGNVQLSSRDRYRYGVDKLSLSNYELSYKLNENGQTLAGASYLNDLEKKMNRNMLLLQWQTK